MSAQMITDSATDLVMRRCIQQVAHAAMRHILPPVRAKLAMHADHDPAAIIRGAAGGVIPLLKQDARVFCYHCGADEQPVDLNPADTGIDQTTRAVPIPKDTPSATPRSDGIATTVGIYTVSRTAAAAGPEALQGKPGAACDSMVYAGVSMLQHSGHHESL